MGRYPARSLARCGPQRAREVKRSRRDLPHRDHLRPGAGIRAKNSRPRRLAREHRRQNDLPALRRIRFGRRCVSDDEARRASFVSLHFYGTGARPGESSVHVARGLVRQLVPWQFTAKLYRVPFEAIQREIVRYAPESCRVLLYRRMMLRIADVLARRDHALAFVTGDSLARSLRKLCGIWSPSGPLRRCLCSVRSPAPTRWKSWRSREKSALTIFPPSHFTIVAPFSCRAARRCMPAVAELDAAEAKLDLPQLVRQGGTPRTALESYHYVAGRVETNRSSAEPLAKDETRRRNRIAMCRQFGTAFLDLS